MATQSTPTTPAKTTEFALNEKPTAVLVEYLKVYVSADADAPHQGLPFIDAKDNVRVKPDHFEGWFTGSALFAGTPNKKQVRAILKDAGLVQKVYALPTVDSHPELTGKSFGLYTGPVPAAAKKLPHRIIERAVPTRTPAADKPAKAKTAKAKPAADESGTSVEQVPASELKVGDVIATSRKAIENGTADTVAAITRDKDSGTRIQARRADGKIIRSFAPETKTWRGRTVDAPSDAAHANA